MKKLIWSKAGSVLSGEGESSYFLNHFETDKHIHNLFFLSGQFCAVAVFCKLG